MLCDMSTRKKFQVKPTTLNTYFAFTGMGWLFLSYCFFSNSNYAITKYIARKPKPTVIQK